jgi:LPXTG-motif cell wall-anchored protein
MVKKIGLVVALLAIAGVASADAGSSDCLHIAFLELFCKAGPGHGPVSAPEIDPASAMAGLTMLAGGLAVLRGRRKKISNE